MAYIGKSPTGTGVRQRYYFTATGGETSLSGSDDNGLTLAFSDGKYVDVMLNGVTLVAGTDYNTSTANTIGGLAALSASDIVEIVVYDIFTVADTVSAKNGGTFSGNVAMGGTLSVTGASTLTGDLTVDTNTLYVDSTNNNVGIGTSSPDTGVMLDVAGSMTTGGTNPTYYFGGSGVSGNAGYIQKTSGSDYALTIVGSNSTNSSVRAPIVFKSGTDTERMRIDSSGNLLVGQTAISGVNARGGIMVEPEKDDGAARITFDRDTTSATSTAILFRDAGSSKGSIAYNNTSTTFSTSSDYRLKENVVADWDATTRLKQLNPVRFNFIVDPDTTVDGFLAHEVQDVVPEAISGTHNEVDDEGNPVYQGIDQSKLTPLLTKALIEAVEKIEQLETRIAALENV